MFPVITERCLFGLIMFRKFILYIVYCFDEHVEKLLTEKEYNVIQMNDIKNISKCHYLNVCSSCGNDI